MLKKQLEERDKQLAAEQEDSAAAKSRLRDLTKVRPETLIPVKINNHIKNSKFDMCIRIKHYKYSIIIDSIR